MMKSALLSLLIIFLAQLSFTQSIKEGFIKFDIEVNSDDAQVNSSLNMMKGSSMNMYFTEDKNRVELNMGAMMNTTTVVDVKKNTGIILLSGILGKKAIKIDNKYIEEAQETQPKSEIIKTKETKKILGYSCTKYKIRVEGGLEIVYWTTNELTASKDFIKGINKNVEGFPLEFETLNQGIKMKFVAVDFKNNLNGENKSRLFDNSIPAGYDEMKMEDLKKMGL